MRYDHFSLLPERAFQPIGRRMTLEGGGKGSQPAAPDYSQIAQSTTHAADLAATAAQNDLDFRKQQYSDSVPQQKRLVDMATQVANQQLDQGNQQSKMAADQNAYYNTTYKPLEQQQALQSQGGLDMSDEQVRNLATQLGISPDQASAMMTSSKGAYENQANQAITQANASSNSAYGQGLRQLTRMGGDPNRLASAAAGMASNQTLAGANAANQARTQAKNQNIALTSGAAAFGRNMPNTAGQMYGLSTNSGNSAVANQNTGFMSGLPYAQYQSGATGNMLGAAGIQQQGALGMGGLMNQSYSTAMQGYNANQGLDLGGLMAGGAKLYTAFGSDRRLKENIVLVGKDETTGLNLYEFNYIDSPSARYRGVMADEVVDRFPEAVIYGPNGYARVRYDMLGIEMVEVES